jgi:VanZ family protein
MKLNLRTGWLLMAILVIAVIFAPAMGNTRWLKTLHDSAHGPIFGCIALLILHIIRAHPTGRSLAAPAQYFISLLVSTLLGAATEVAQGFTGRDASFADAFHDVVGAAAFLAVFAAFDPKLQARSNWARVSTLTFSAALLAFLVAPVVRSAVEYRQRDHLFPVLVDFSHDFDRYFVGQRSTAIDYAPLPPWAVKTNDSALRVTFLAGSYPGIDIAEPLPDWSAYSTLAFDLTNPTPLDLDLVLRVDDAHHNQQYADRYNKTYRLPAHSRTVLRVPLSEIQSGPVARLLDLHNMASVVLFREQGSRASQMYLSRAWLE